MYKHRLIIVSLVIVILSGIAITAVFRVIPPDHQDFNSIALPVTTILSALLASAIVVIIVDIALKGGRDKELGQLFMKSMKNAIWNTLSIPRSGIECTYERFHNTAFISEAKAGNGVFILQTYAPNLSNIQEALEKTLNEGGRVRIALIHRESDFAKSRWPEVDGSLEGFFGGVDKNVKVISGLNIKDKFKNNLEVRYYKCAPGVCIYGVEEKSIMLGSFLSGRDSVSSPFIKLSFESNGYSIFVEHFERIWDSAEISNGS